jgi:hypothetical protein
MSLVLDGSLGVTTNSGTLISATTIGVGGATPSTSGAGITFPATQSASTDANTLDDYEEGTWTPSITFGGTSTGVTYSSTRIGRYTKIGRIVTLAASIALTSKGSSTGNVQITGLPFTPYNATGVPVYAGIFVGEGGLSSMSTGTYCLAWNDLTLYIRFNGSTGLLNLTDANFTNSSSFYLTITYEVV